MPLVIGDVPYDVLAMLDILERVKQKRKPVGLAVISVQPSCSCTKEAGPLICIKAPASCSCLHNRDYYFVSVIFREYSKVGVFSL